VLSSEPTEGDTYPNDTWRAHRPHDPSWTYDSYAPVATVVAAQDHWKLQNTIASTLSDGIVLVMCEHVFPCWDDKYNIDGATSPSKCRTRTRKRSRQRV
jgi:hypothetical protein